jgi:hypothetical protein
MTLAEVDGICAAIRVLQEQHGAVRAQRAGAPV